MSDSQAESAAPRSDSTSSESAAQKRALAASVIGEILQRMDFMARIELKDGADGGIAVALHFASPVPGVQPGRRSHFIESLQFIANKVVNRPGSERRWISIGVGGYPEPRPPRLDRTPRQPPQPPPAQRTVEASGPPAPALKPPPQRTAPDESALEVAEDAALSRVVRQMAEKSGRLGRYYGIASMVPADRSRVLKAVADIAGVRVALEGEGRNRRVVFTPEKPSPMPRRTVLDYGEDEGEET